MQTEEIKNEALERHVKVTILSADIDAKYQTKLSEVQALARVPGYRQGKVPQWLVLKQFGSSIYEDVVRDFIEESAKTITKDLELVQTPILDDLEKEKGKDVSFVLKFEVFPDITLPDLRNISIEKPVFSISEDDTKSDIEKIIEDATSYEDSEEKATKTSGVVVDIKGKTADGEDFPQKEIKEVLFRLDKDTLFSDKFNKALVGKKAGDSVEITVEYKKDFDNKSIAGKSVTYQVQIHLVKSPVYPDLNDDFAKNIGYVDLEDLKKDLIKKKEHHYDEQVHTLLSMRLFDKLEDLLTFDVPKSILEQEIKSISAEIENLKNEDESLKNKNEEELKEYSKKFAARRVKIGMMLNEYAKHKNIKITSEDIQKAVLKRVSMFPSYMQQELLNWYYKNPQNLQSISGAALEHKVVETILSNDLKLNEKSYSLQAINELIEKETENKMY
jgi:trigger factor